MYYKDPEFIENFYEQSINVSAGWYEDQYSVDVLICKNCGSLIFDEDKHLEFHKGEK